MPRAARSPRLPRALEPAHLSELVDGEELAGRAIDADLVGCRAHGDEIAESRLGRGRATGSDLTRLRLRDVLLEGCELVGVLALRDATVDPVQAVGVGRAMDLSV